MIYTLSYNRTCRNHCSFCFFKVDFFKTGRGDEKHVINLDKAKGLRPFCEPVMHLFGFRHHRHYMPTKYIFSLPVSSLSQFITGLSPFIPATCQSVCTDLPVVTS